eukprot:31175-Pelagococcus_subviridis.AAC.5
MFPSPSKHGSSFTIAHGPHVLSKFEGGAFSFSFSSWSSAEADAEASASATAPRASSSSAPLATYAGKFAFENIRHFPFSSCVSAHRWLMTTSAIGAIPAAFSAAISSRSSRSDPYGVLRS